MGLFGLLAVFLMGASAHAGQVTNEDALLAGARQCTQHMPLQETKYGIPRHLLMAIGSNESGRYHKGINAVVPWPWTVNAAGKGYYFDSKQEAISAVTKLRAQGIESIDVGCMQVNLKHHAKAFNTLQEAFDPQSNVAYAARFLRTNFDAAGSWMKATAFYHSQTPKFGNPYMQAVYNRWKGVLTRTGSSPGQALATATATAPANAREIASLEMASLNVVTNAPHVSRPYGAKATIDTNSRAPKADPSPKMKVIRVYNRDAQFEPAGFTSERDHGVNVVRTDLPHPSAPTPDATRAVSTQIVQDMAAQGIAAGNQPTVNRAQFQPRAVRISSAADDGFVIRN